MDENWYAAEQEVRDRITEARAAARIRTLTRGLRPEVRPQHFVRTAVIRLVGWVLTRASSYLPRPHAGSPIRERPQSGTWRGRP